MRTLSPAARLLFFAAICGGVAAAAIRIPDVAHWHGTDVLALGGLAAAILVTELFSVPLRLRTETLNFMLTDAAYIAGLILVRPSVLSLGLVAGVVAGQLMKRWDVRKVAYNVGVYLIGITAAQFIVRAVAGAAPLAAREPRTWATAVLGMAAFAVINVVLVSGIISLVERKSFAHVVAPTLGLEVAHRAGNVAIGLMFAVLYKVSPLALPPAALVVGLAFLAYQGWVAAIRERDGLRVLHEVERRLVNPLDVAAEMEPVLHLVKRMLGAASVELSVFDGEDARTYSSEGTPAAVAADGNGNGHRAMGDPESSQIAMVGGDGGMGGMLIIRRSRPLSDSERSVLESVASRISVMFHNNRLFMETLEQAELADVVSHTWDGIFVVSQEGRVVSWNPSMERITGVARDQALGRSCVDVLGFEPVIDLTDATAQSSNGHGNGSLGNGKLNGLVHSNGNGHGPSGSRDIVVPHVDGTERWVRYTYRPLGKRGARAGYVVVVRDVTAELETEQLKADFVATVSHELRTPLTPLKGFLITLARGIGDGTPEERQAYYRIMLNQANRLERLITDLLEASRIESGQPVVEAQHMDVAETVDEVLRMFQEEYPDRTIRAVIDGPVMVDADPLRVDQVITNLVSNAIKYSPRESVVEVRVEKEDGQATLSVRDRGWGIAPADQERVFERFFRVENALTRRTGGTGLGLYLAKQLVQAMSGRLWVVSRPGEGSTFSFTLPLAERSGPASGKGGAVSVSA